MKAIIIEDEHEALERLERLLVDLNPEIKIVGTADSIDSAVSVIKKNPDHDLILMDIHLADGPSFEIFKKMEVTSPVIFVTAYDEYAIDAFKVNSVDYLLKPVKKAELEKALEKFEKLNKKDQAFEYHKLIDLLSNDKRSYQKRIVVRFGQHIRTYDISEAAYFFSQEKITFIVTHDGKKSPIDYNLEELEGILNAKEFFRINRQFIISFKAIKDMFTYPKARVKIVLNPPAGTDTIVSSERSASFKDWLHGK